MRTGWSLSTPCWGTAIYYSRDPDASAVTVTFSAAAAQASRTREMGIAMSVVRHNDFFFGWRVVGAAFVLAVLAWGAGFYGPPIYLQALQENRSWPVGRDN